MKHCSLEAPPWVYRRLFGTQASEAFSSCPQLAAWRAAEPDAPHEHLDLRRLRGQDETWLFSVRLRAARNLEAGAFQDACEWTYDRLRREILALPDGDRPWQVLRLWNFIPHILAPLGDLEHRYMVFNAGRYRAMERWLDDMENVATASGVGHFGGDFVVHCLVGRDAGQAVENPRQIPAYRYSQRYGPLPPCFARATRIHPDQAPETDARLLIGGTAAVRGEDSLHPEDLDAQLHETLVNLAAVTRAALSSEAPSAGSRTPGAAPEGRALTPLRAFESVRVYYVRPEDRQRIADVLRRRLPDGTEIELRHAELCRPELLVEIEAVADLSLLQGTTAEDKAEARATEAGGEIGSLRSRLAV